MTLEELKAKIDQFLQLDRELQEVGKYRADDLRGFFQANAVKIAKYAKDNGLKVEIKTRECDRYPGEVTVPEIKMFGVASDEEVQEIKAMLEEKAVEEDA